jgi:4-hydroxyphenylpyruvate dioxygenase
MTSTATTGHGNRPEATDPPVLGGIDHVEWWVGNARAFSGFLVSAFGFDVVAYAGPETGRRDRVSHVLQQGRICFLVDDAEAAYDAALARGALPERPPAVDHDELGSIHHAAIRTYGETVHTFLDRSAYAGEFAPGFGPPQLPPAGGPPVGLTRFDHIVANVERGHLEEWVDYYEHVLGFDPLVHFGDDQISTEYSALMSTVVWNHDKVVLPINEPAEGRRKSQIEEYLDYYRAPGVQHMALHTPDIVGAVRAMRERGVRFLTVPPEYYKDARERMAGIDLPWEDLAELGVMVDRDQDGHLLQIFTETLCDRPTVFFEIIQRAGATGFGAGNFKALFEAIERAQDARGNL